MEYDEMQAFIEAERERRKTPREREIHKELALLGEKHKRALMAESEPLLKELAEIEARKGPMPIIHDGKIYEYVGPKYGA